MKSKMKYILIGLLLLSGFSNVRAQDALDKFRQEMGKLESLESEYHKVILERRIIRKHYTDSIGRLFQAIRQEKRDFAQKAVDNNRSDKAVCQSVGDLRAELPDDRRIGGRFEKILSRSAERAGMER